MSVLIALLLDGRCGEPPARLHPVVAMGTYLETAGRCIPRATRGPARVGGAAAWLLGVVLVGVGAVATQRAVGRLPRILGTAATGAALWPLLSLRLLLDEVQAVEQALTCGDLPAARRCVARLVSRPTAGLPDGEVREAALESLAENLSDSLVAPLLWFTVGGLPGAAVYRYVNTADAMWGYRDDAWRWAGTVAARADDVANLLPARFTALLLGAPHVSARALQAEAARTSSPNAGWPMAALALHLDVRLSKAGAYALNAGGRRPQAEDTAAALHRARLAGRVTGLAAALVYGVTRSRGWRRG